MKNVMNRLQDYYYQCRTVMKNKWNRVLPLSEYFVDRWEKARFLNFGEKTSIYDSSIVMGDVKVGGSTWIGPYTMLDGSGARLEIGNHCNISTGVQIYTHDTVKNCVSGGLYSKEVGSVRIGDNCYIAPASIISKGVILGRSCVVCAESFVNKSYEDFSIIGGIPAKKIGEVEILDKGEVHLRYYSRMQLDEN